MKTSFHRKLLSAFLAVGVVPLLICVLVLLDLFRVSLDRRAEEEAAVQLTAMAGDMGALLRSCQGVMDRLSRQPQVLEALAAGEGPAPQAVYNALYTAAAPLLRDASFSLYTSQGRLLYATAGAPGDLSPRWGVLAAAGRTEGPAYQSVSDFAGGEALRAALAVPGEEGPAGYVVLELSDAHFRRLLEGKHSAGSEVLVLDPFWSQVYASPSLSDASLAPTLRARLLAGEGLEGEDRLYHVQQEPVSGFYLLLCQPKPVAGWVMRTLYLIALGAILLSLGLCLAVSMVLSDQLFRPILSLNNAMAAVEEGDLDVRVTVSGADEMSQLAGRFNRMAQRLKENLARSLRQQEELGQAQLRMMQAQLNPHFLYNTLDTLKWLGKIHHIPEVASISADLAEILRRSISAGAFVTLEEELRSLDHYVAIQSIRFAGKFTFQTQADPSLLAVPLPKLTLQPLVENAIIHGFEDGVPGTVTVTAARQGDEMVLTVSDNGCGMSRESLERFRSGAGEGHLGLYNVDAILRLHYGRGLTFLPPDGGRGTRIRIAIPIVPETKDMTGT